MAFNLSNKRYYSINSTAGNTNNGQLGSYLGLIEGDPEGHIYVSSAGDFQKHDHLILNCLTLKIYSYL